MERPPDSEEPDREQNRLERLIPEIIKRLLETGYEKLAEGPESVRNLLAELMLPKEALFSQLDETKNGLYRAVAREVRDFLDHTNFAEELAKALTTLSFEIRTEVRFIPNDSRIRASPEVKTKVNVRRTKPPESTNVTAHEPAPPSSGKPTEEKTE